MGARRAIFLLFSLIFASPGSALALDASVYRDLQTPFYDPNSAVVGRCLTGSASSSSAQNAPTNVDYAGRPILDQGQTQLISQNAPIYQQAAQQVGIPWQMLAVAHLRETGLKRANPSNGQGIYQFYDKHGGPYPAGPVSDAEFLRQTILAAQFLKNAASANYANHQFLDASADGNTIKDTFFSYNGRAAAYAQQAASLGFSASTQAYEGSPYVMNKADAQRDPDRNPTKWGQIKVDNGPIEYPANGDYGAFVEYAALAGIPINNCVPGDVRQAIVQLAQQELQSWQGGQLQPGSGALKYIPSKNIEDWCADFVSWVYNQAGVPLSDGDNGNVSSVLQIQSIGQSGANNFSYHDAAGYNPKPGDIAVHIGSGIEHVTLVVAVDGNNITLIGGNQGGRGGPGTSSVSQFEISSPTDYSTVGYVSPD